MSFAAASLPLKPTAVRSNSGSGSASKLCSLGQLSLFALRIALIRVHVLSEMLSAEDDGSQELDHIACLSFYLIKTVALNGFLLNAERN
jgi:hypothetical protein